MGSRVGPQTQAAVLVPHVERLPGCVADGIVRPGCELVLAAVPGPGVARARLGDLEAELRVRHHVDPGSRGPLPLAQNRDVFAAARVRIRRGRSRGSRSSAGGGTDVGRLARRAQPRRDRPGPGPLQPNHLLGERSAVRGRITIRAAACPGGSGRAETRGRRGADTRPLVPSVAPPPPPGLLAPCLFEGFLETPVRRRFRWR